MTMAEVFGVRNWLKPSATMRRASTSSPESVSSRMLNEGSSTAIWKISLRFRSPPEKPSFTPRLMKCASSPTSLRFSRSSFRNSVAPSGSWPKYFRFAFTAARMKFVIDTPGISIGAWKDMKMPSWLRSSGESVSRSLPLKVTLPSVTSYFGFPTRTLLSVDFPEPLGPIRTCTSPSLMVRFTPLSISRPSTEAWRFFISSIIVL